MNILTLLRSPFAVLAVGAVIFSVYFLYYLFAFFLPQSQGAKHFQAKRYAEAAAVFQAVLKRRPPAGIEADTRRRLADTLDILGRSEEAAQERERAEAAATKGGTDPAALEAKGVLLERQGRHDDACFYFDLAVKKMPNLPGARSPLMAKLALAHHAAGRSAETLRWAQMSLANSPNKVIKPLMHRMSGIALSDQGDLEQAEAQHRLALELTEKLGNPDETAQSLALLASLLSKKGHYEEAIIAARRSREVAPNPSRMDIAVEAECLRDMGRFDEARAVMRRHFDGPRFPQPHVERKMQALGSLGMTWIETRAEQPEAAWGHLEAVREGLKASVNSAVWPPAPSAGVEEKLVLWCDATAVNILSQKGKDAEARALRESVESRLMPFASDYATLRGTYFHLARASLQMGDLAECHSYCQRYAECRPSPSSMPTLYYLLGETHLRLGEIETARGFFRQAVALGIDSLDARRAQARLNELGG